MDPEELLDLQVLRPIAMLPKVLQDMVIVFQEVQVLGEVVRTTAMVLAGTISVTIVVVQLVVSITKPEEISPRIVSSEALLAVDAG